MAIDARPGARFAGFTLIEMIIVVVLIGILAAALVPVASTSLRAYNDVNRDVMALDRLRYATERLAREIREVNYDATTGFAFTTLGTTGTLGSLEFARTYFDATTGTPSGNVTVTVGNTGSAVTLQYSGAVSVGAQTLVDELGSLSFGFYDKDGVSTTSKTSVRFVEISLSLAHVYDGDTNTYSQRTRVELKRFENS